MASSSTASVTSRHNKAPVASASVNPICRPALSNPSCNGRGANRSRALTNSLIFIVNRKFGCKYSKKQWIENVFYSFYKISVTNLSNRRFSSNKNSYRKMFYHEKDYLCERLL